jgi:hypothetical protein
MGDPLLGEVFFQVDAVDERLLILLGGGPAFLASNRGFYLYLENAFEVPKNILIDWRWQLCELSLHCREQPRYILMAILLPF